MKYICTLQYIVMIIIFSLIYYFNHLISISKQEFFLILFFQFWTTLFQIQFAKNLFNIILAEVQKHVVSKNSICDNIFLLP
jgi:uncharacterized membrane protein